MSLQDAEDVLCPVCGKSWGVGMGEVAGMAAKYGAGHRTSEVLKPRTPQELAAIKPITEESIKAAFARGHAARTACEMVQRGQAVPQSVVDAMGVQTSGYVTSDSPPCATCGTIMAKTQDPPAAWQTNPWKCSQCHDPHYCPHNNVTIGQTYDTYPGAEDFWCHDCVASGTRPIRNDRVDGTSE